MEQARKSCFKALEILITGLVIGTVGSVVVPALTQAGCEEKTVSVAATLHYMRGQIDYYRARHNGAMPPVVSEKAFLAAVNEDSSEKEESLRTMPVNMFNGLRTIRFSVEADQGKGKAGWHFNTRTGEFHADDTMVHARL
jgi:competence protein ComGC